jgi:hypothetical protein
MMIAKYIVFHFISFRQAVVLAQRHQRFRNNRRKEPQLVEGRLLATSRCVMIIPFLRYSPPFCFASTFVRQHVEYAMYAIHPYTTMKSKSMPLCSFVI